LERGGLIVALALCACRPDAAADRDELQRAIDADEAVSQVFQEALQAEKAADGGAAVDILKRSGEPAAKQASDAAAALAPRSAWGRAQRDALVALERDRSDELAKYETALAAKDDDATVASLERQIALEKRAKALWDEIHRGP